MEIDNPELMEQGFPFPKGLRKSSVISTSELYEPPTLKFPCRRISACGDVASKNLHTVLLTRRDTDVFNLEVKMINVDNTVEKDKRETCRRGNSSVCPSNSLNPASLVKTDPSLTLKIRCECSVFHLSKFLSMTTSSPRSAPEVAFQTFPFAGAPASICKKTWIGNLFTCISFTSWL